MRERAAPQIEAAANFERRVSSCPRSAVCEFSGGNSIQRVSSPHIIGNFLLPLWAASKTIVGQIKAIPVLAETKNVYVAGGNPQAFLFVTLALQNAQPPLWRLRHDNPFVN